MSRFFLRAFSSGEPKSPPPSSGGTPSVPVSPSSAPTPTIPSSQAVKGGRGTEPSLSPSLTSSLPCTRLPGSIAREPPVLPSPAFKVMITPSSSDSIPAWERAAVQSVSNSTTSCGGGTKDGGGGSAGAGGGSFDLKRMPSMEEGGEDEEGEDGEGEDLDLLSSFNPRKAHEVFIWMALNGQSPEELASSGRPAASMDVSGSRRLKWADEDGGTLKHIQYFDKDAEPSAVLHAMLAADARAEGAPGSGKAAQGREEIVKNMRPIIAQIQGMVQEVAPVKVMKNGETRTVLVAGRGPFRTRVGVAIVWMGGLIQHLKMIKNPDAHFLEDEPEEEPPHTTSSPGTPEQDPSPRSNESDIFVLNPPYLVPRPHVFPVPTLTVGVISAHNLKSSAKLPRPLNPYVKLKLGGIEQRTPVITSNKNPVWGGHSDDSRFRFSAGDPNAILHVTVGDWKIGKNLWIARLVIPLASIEVCMAGEGIVKDYELRCRTSRFTKHIEKEGTGNSKLVLRLQYEHMERWWTVQELKARDQLRQSREEEAALELSSSLAAEQSKKASTEHCCIS